MVGVAVNIPATPLLLSENSKKCLTNGNYCSIMITEKHKSRVLSGGFIMYINRKNALEILGQLAREPHYQHEGEDYYVGISEASGEIYCMPSAKMEDYELTIETIKYYKRKACELIDGNCNKCQAMYKHNDKQWCCFDNVEFFIEWANKYNVV